MNDPCHWAWETRSDGSAVSSSRTHTEDTPGSARFTCMVSVLPQSSPKRQLSYVILHMGNRPREVSMVRSSHSGLVAEPGFQPKPCCAVIPWGSALPACRGLCGRGSHSALLVCVPEAPGEPGNRPHPLPCMEVAKRGKSPHPKHRG